MSSTDTVRLHITPFNPSIYERNIPEAVRNNNPKVSFHAVQTFPERGFGYLEVARSDAETIKRKLNGSILKGVKIRIEEARPMKRKSDAAVDEAVEEPRKKRSKKVKAEKRVHESVLPGYELPADRAVKRGWADEKGAVKKVKKSGESKTHKVDREKSKLLFKTTVPPNLKATGTDKVKKQKDKADKKRTRKNEVVVKEFDHNRSTFAVSKASSTERKLAVEYRDGDGWVDEDGNVVEAETAQSKRRRGQAAPIRLPAGKVVDKRAEDNADTSGSSGKDSSDEDDEDEGTGSDGDEKEHIVKQALPIPEQDSSDALEDDNQEAVAESTSGSDAEDKQLDEATPPPTNEVHPLEALYKRPKADVKEQLAPINTSFSFFGASEGADDTTEDASVLPPQTPHTKQDLDWRQQRSAAPTPDTAAIDGRFGFPFSPSDEDDEDTELPTPSQPATRPVDSAVEVGEESEFRKFFFANRGDTDRAWKKKRREAKKLERQRENRRLSRRIV